MTRVSTFMAAVLLAIPAAVENAEAATPTGSCPNGSLTGGSSTGGSSTGPCAFLSTANAGGIPNDGCSGAPAGAIQHASLLSSYPVRPQWDVAGVDYYVGVPSNITLQDPTTASLPSGVTINPSTHTITIAASNVMFSGFDLSLHGGFQINITNGASNVTIKNNNFSAASGNLYFFVHSDATTSNITVSNNTIDGGQAANCAWGELIYTQGPGVTVAYNWIKNAGQHSLSVGGGGSVQYHYNLLENGAWCPGAHLNFLQYVGGNYTNPQVSFNTVIQTITRAGGEVFQMYNNFTGPISNGIIGYNTVITSPTLSSPLGSAPAVSYVMHAGIPTGSTASPSTGTVVANYIDGRSDYGAFYPGLSGWSYSNNIDMVHNTVILSH